MPKKTLFAVFAVSALSTQTVTVYAPHTQLSSVLRQAKTPSVRMAFLIIFILLPDYSCLPHFMQNFASAPFSMPHAGQYFFPAGVAGCSG